MAPGVQPETSRAEHIPSWGKGERSNARIYRIQVGSQLQGPFTVLLLHEAEQS